MRRSVGCWPSWRPASLPIRHRCCSLWFLIRRDRERKQLWRRTMTPRSGSLFALAALLFVLPSLAAKQIEAGEPSMAAVFVSGTEGYKFYCIPSLVCTPKGTLLAFCEGRKFWRRGPKPDRSGAEAESRRRQDVAADAGDRQGGSRSRDGSHRGDRPRHGHSRAGL